MSYPFTILIKPAGPDCNISCKYCFYCRKSDYFNGQTHRMSPDTQKLLIKQYLELNLPQSSFAFQGGEPTLMGLDFYRRHIELQNKYSSPNQAITNSLQTNAILIDDSWAAFLAQNNFLIGISIDGPAKFHDHFRVDHAGQPTHAKVMQAIECCKQHKVDFNTLTLLNNINAEHPEELFSFLSSLGTEYLQFIPCVEISDNFNTNYQPTIESPVTSFSVQPEQYGRFLCKIFDLWKMSDPAKLHIRTFDSIMMSHIHGTHAECTFMPKCADYVVVEHNGDVFCCDFFVDDDTYLGNIHETHINDLANSPQKREFNRKKRSRLANKCKLCRHFDSCRGGCPKDRIASGALNQPSYLCQGYQLFFDHALAELREIASRIAIANS